MEQEAVTPPYIDWALFCRKVTKDAGATILHDVLTVVPVSDGIADLFIVAAMRAPSNTRIALTIGFQAPGGAATTKGPDEIQFNELGLLTLVAPVRIPVMLPGPVSAHFLFAGQDKPSHVTLFQLVRIAPVPSPEAPKAH
jgi:hypothetical protein